MNLLGCTWRTLQTDCPGIINSPCKHYTQHHIPGVVVIVIQHGALTASIHSLQHLDQAFLHWCGIGGYWKSQAGH